MFLLPQSYFVILHADMMCEVKGRPTKVKVKKRLLLVMLTSVFC